jgi:hypothetical protein
LAKVGPMLHWLDSYLLDHDVAELHQITSAHLDAFIASRPRPSPRSYNGLIGAVRGLLDWMVVHELLPRSPLGCETRRVTPTLRPFVKGVLKIDRRGGAKPDHSILFSVFRIEFAEALERRPAPPVGRCV